MAKSPAKVILFGEHFVVHGSYAIASSINECFATVEIIDKDDWGAASDYSNVNILYNKEKVKEGGTLHNAALIMLNEFNIKKNMKINVTSNIKGSGLGSSASFCVAFARELNKRFNLGLTDNKVNELAYVGETAFHGTSSGIDNTVCCFGGIIQFRKDKRAGMEGVNIQKIVLKDKINLIVVYTDKSSSTKEMVEKVNAFKERHEEKFAQMIKEVNTIIDDAKYAMQTGAVVELGRLMLQNQKLLEEIGVSTPEVKGILNIAINNGALGGKLTGGGGGGSVILLYDKDTPKYNIISSLEKAGYSCFTTKIG
ncbi:mevalonate kinase [Candidatus Woesearchaeota archaeon]|nr:mevalonate kinase [Candidatus Woesearchaeota archaeon]